MTWLYLSFIDDNGDEPGVSVVGREKRIEIFYLFKKSIKYMRKNKSKGYTNQKDK